ncbi:MAG: thiamine pyrophosphate-dependent dehydrogenase E1 component subunit alpha [Rhodospirillaceae bacterium]|nr:thiamine pyrophosphate-dependent dehydrogenase E1 component subunit alpha [Rhodospirillaceae bacterium]
MSNGPSPQARLDMHFAMLRLRRVEEAIARHYREGEMRCPTHLCIGQEAIAAGISAHLRPDDYAFSGHRSHGHYLAKGGDLQAMFSELYGRETGCARGRGGSQHLIDLEAGFVASAPILAGTLPIAVGAAFGAKRLGRDTVSVVYFGDGATEEGSFHEAMNFASLYKLPVLFVCENNLYSVHSDLAVRQPANRQIADIGQAHGMPGIHADGNDIETVWLQAADAVQRARTGGGPTLMEFMTYRWLEHVGPNPDGKVGYRAQVEIDDWAKKCPIVRSEAQLRKAGLLDDAKIAAQEKRLDDEINQVISAARAAPFPDPATLLHYTLPERV